MSKNVAKCIFTLFFFLYLRVLLMKKILVMAENTKIEVNIGVVLDLDDDMVGKMGLSCISLALRDFYATHAHYKTRLVPNTRDSNKHVVGAASAALDLIKNKEVQAIIGTTTSTQTNFIIELGEKAQVPIVSFAASSPFLTSVPSPYFFQATQNVKTQINAIASIIQTFGWTAAVPIYVDNEYGVGIIAYLIGALQEVDTRVPYQSAISPSASDDQLLTELSQLMKMRTRVFIVHMFPSLGARFFNIAKEIGMMGDGYVWIMTDWMTNLLCSLGPSVIDSMQGSLGVKTYFPKAKKLEDFRVRWKRKFHQDYPDIVDAELNIYGLWAYDATMALAIAIEKATGTTNSRFYNPNVNSNNRVVDLESLEVFQNGLKLIQELSNTSFKGLTGDFLFVNQQLKSSALEIVNVIGAGARGVGFWTPEKGLVKKLNSAAQKATSNFKASLATIIWPLDSTNVPKGWEIPTNEKRLRVGVPAIGGGFQFVKVRRDPETSRTSVTGYCIDVFDAVMKELPYTVAYDYIPFNGTCNDLVYQVYLGNFDAVVADMTIVANRSLYVDFTLPYIESEILMLVQNNNKKKSAVIFLKPLSCDLWLTTFCFFLLVGFVIWVLEHRINKDIPPPSASHQGGAGLWFAVSTMVFPHWERVNNNLGRVVVITWSFVLFILLQGYTASLTSLLTVQQLRPAFTDVSELIQNRESVGCLNGSFIVGILKKLGFQDSQILTYHSPQECHKLLSQGSRNGGIVAAFDESPYMNIIMAQSCSLYTIVEPAKFISKIPTWSVQQFKTDGFGFAFRRGSPLVDDVSRAILKVTEDDQMRRINNAWFGAKSTCQEPGNSVSSSILGLSSFWSLFVVAGTASILALVTSIVMFIHQQKEILKHSDTIWSRIHLLLRIFNQMEPKVNASRTSELNDKEHRSHVSAERIDTDSNARAFQELIHQNLERPTS